jgi:hypothetical protein
MIMIMLAMGISACRKEEQGRPLSYDKGNYQGKTDQSLSDIVVNNLIQRSRYQSYN